jgi:3D (Asp-Asp-Asp) domain-containing protein
MKKHAGTLAYLLLFFVMANAVLVYYLLKTKNIMDELRTRAALAGNWESISLEYENKIKSYESEIETFRLRLEEYEAALVEAEEKNNALAEEKRELEERNTLMTPSYDRWNLYTDRYAKASRSDYSREQAIIDSSIKKRMRVTAYTEYECDKDVNHPLFGITASGNRVQDWFTVAAGKELPFGTRIYIPYFKDEINNGIFVVEDRGGAIKENCIDVYMSDQKAVNVFGCKWLDVYILD